MPQYSTIMLMAVPFGPLLLKEFLLESIMMEKNLKIQDLMLKMLTLKGDGTLGLVKKKLKTLLLD